MEKINKCYSISVPGIVSGLLLTFSFSSTAFAQTGIDTQEPLIAQAGYGRPYHHIKTHAGSSDEAMRSHKLVRKFGVTGRPYHHRSKMRRIERTELAAFEESSKNNFRLDTGQGNKPYRR